MIMYATDSQNEQHKVVCVKCKNPPKLNNPKVYYTFINGIVNGVETKFFYNVKNNASYMYFSLGSQFYKVCMVTEDGMDLFTYLYEKDGELKT